MPDGATAPRYGFPPRLMRAPAAAYYLGMSESAFRERVAPDVPPVRIGGIVGWLRESLDAWLDRQAGADARSPQANPWHEP
jgi:predicted DNA-binding transcriptional regulator AlpA